MDWSVILASVIAGGATVAAAWIDRDRFRRRRHVDGHDLQKADAIIVRQRAVIHRQLEEIRSLRRQVDAERSRYD